uniref:SH3 domain-containing protein n=1 Tax=Bursaphelenchus xylophilus TaxID=6326 RepID=A0A1I7RKS9_BURXY
MNGHSGEREIRAIAKFNFEGKNNDELTFQKNDVITITQQIDGGWWEGSLEGHVGWFPSDYVGVIKTESSARSNGVSHDAIDGVPEDLEKQKALFRTAIVEQFIKDEAQHIGALEEVANVILPVVFEAKLFNPTEQADIKSNLLDVIHIKQDVLGNLEETFVRPIMDQRIGDIFLRKAGELKILLRIYCWKHPVAIHTITKKSKKADDNLERQRKIDSVLKKEEKSFKDLIAGLSLVFRHTDKYASFLLEVERNTSQSHPDLGNLHRASIVYREIAEDCVGMRKQKELQLEFLNSGFLEKAVGKDHQEKLGPLMHFTSVTVTQPNQQDPDAVLDRSVVLCSKALLLLEPSIEKNTYILKEKLATNGLIAAREENSLRISFVKDNNHILIVSCLSAEDFYRFNLALDGCQGIEVTTKSVNPTPIPSTPDSTDNHNVVSDLHRSLRPPLSKKNSVNSNGGLNHELEMIDPDSFGQSFDLSRSSSFKPLHSNLDQKDRRSRPSKLFSGFCLRPIPPNKSAVALQTSSSSSSIKLRKGLTAEEQEDAYLFKIIEGYCGPPSSSNNVSKFNSRMNVSSSSLHHKPQVYIEEVRPQVIVAGDEKLLIEEATDDGVVFKEKTLVDTVYDMSTRMTALEKQIHDLTKIVIQEQKNRRRLEESLRRQSNNYSHTSSPKPELIESTSS